MRAWRIVKARFTSSAFTGVGARRAGGRWNSKGVPMVYTAGSPSLAILEMLVHLESEEFFTGYVLLEVSFDDQLVERLQVSVLPDDWRSSPPPPALRQIGDAWIASHRTPILGVPSAVVPIETNYLLNPDHPEFDRIRIGEPAPVQFDPRLIERLGS